MPFFMNHKFQEFNNFNSMNMTHFHDDLNNIMMMILTMIMFSILSNLKKSLSVNTIKQKESNSLEMFWTMLPSLLIFFLSIPSLTSLYLNEEFKKPMLDLKIIGNQWYWSYQYLGMMKINSYLNESLLLRNLSTDTSIIMPSNTNIRLHISSNDVIHSWSLPSLMVKMDAIPGRINSTMMNSSKTVKLKGQCSEICGMNHSFMPISILMTSSSKKM